MRECFELSLTSSDPFFFPPVAVTCSGDAKRLTDRATHTRTHKSAPSPSFYRQDLGSARVSSWTLTNSNGSISGIPAVVPGNVYSDLLSGGILVGDPYYRANEALFQWVAYDDWSWSCTFDLDAGLDSFDSIELESLGIDTIATIHLNGEYVGGTNDMHLRFIFQVKSLLKPVGNVLSITIYSAIKQGLQASEAYPYTG